MKLRLFCLATLLAMLFGTPVHATSTLAFEGGGYSMTFEIGHTDRPVIASIHFYEPGDTKGVVLRESFQVRTFDTKRKALRLVYSGRDQRVPPFTLVVHANTSTLSIGGKRIASTFSWEM
jgi:hypothetical protein